MGSWKKGSASVFLVMITAVMFSLVFAYITATGKIAGTGYADSILNLAGRSVLSEFDRALMDEYGIFAFRGNEYEIKEKFSYYADYTFEKNERVRFLALDVDNSKHSLANVDVFESAVTDHMKYAFARGLVNDAIESAGAVNKEPEKSPREESEERDHILRNEKIINSLPSGELGKTGNILESVKEGISSWQDALKKGSTNYLVNRYILMNFKNAQNREINRETFFSYEAEYIISGSLDDRKNKNKFRAMLFSLRNVINYIHVFSDPVKRTELIAAAELMTPGPAGLITQLILAEAWALAESENDLRLLENGKKVPVYKTKETWAVDLDSIVKGTETGYIDTHVKSGLDYQGYLQIFLFFQDRATKTARIMDSIQINIQGTHDKTFLIKDHNCGFSFKANVDGRQFSYDEEY